MEKMITRTVVRYVHLFGKMDVEKMTMEVTHRAELNEKLGSRKAQSYIKAQNLGDVKLLGVQSVERLYSMPLSVFLEHATEVQDDVTSSED